MRNRQAGWAGAGSVISKTVRRAGPCDFHIDLKSIILHSGRTRLRESVSKNPGPNPQEAVAVTANGMRVPKSETDGWRYAADRDSIEPMGSWCARIQAGAITELEATFACTEAVIPLP